MQQEGARNEPATHTRAGSLWWRVIRRQSGYAADVRYLKNGAAKAIRTLRAADADAAPTDRVIGLSPLQIQRRFTAAARAAGIEARLTAHSGRVGLASELTARGASTTEVMLAGNWKTARMVAHYSAGATIAKVTGLSENTLYWHLQQIYEKKAISRQVDLVRLVLSINAFG